MVALKPQISPIVSIALRNMERKYMHTSDTITQKIR